MQAGSSPLSEERSTSEGRFFLPRRTFAQCVKISTETDDATTAQLDTILETLNTNTGSLSSGQTAILQAISSPGATCDLTSLEGGQTTIINGQTTITTDISAVSSDLTTTKDMILAAITDLDTEIGTLSTDLDTAKTMILDGQTTINTNIADVSTQITTLGNMILAQLTTIDGKLDDLETGQQEICDKIDALEVKIDDITDIITDTCPAGATLNDGKCYTVSDTKVNYADAAAACVADGATLATMTAANEAFLYNLVYTEASSQRAWLGLTMTSGSWAWEDGSLYGVFTDWDGAEPTAPTRQCADAGAFANPPSWKDRPCTDRTFYVCQSDAT